LFFLLFLLYFCLRLNEDKGVSPQNRRQNQKEDFRSQNFKVQQSKEIILPLKYPSNLLSAIL